MGEHEKAMAWMAAGLDEHDPMCVYLKVMLTCDPLRGDPRF